MILIFFSACALCLLTGLLSSAFPVVFALVSQILSPNSKSKKNEAAAIPQHLPPPPPSMPCRHIVQGAGRGGHGQDSTLHSALAEVGSHACSGPVSHPASLQPHHHTCVPLHPLKIGEWDGRRSETIERHSVRFTWLQKGCVYNRGEWSGGLSQPAPTSTYGPHINIWDMRQRVGRCIPLMPWGCAVRSRTRPLLSCEYRVWVLEDGIPHPTFSWPWAISLCIWCGTAQGIRFHLIT